MRSPGKAGRLLLAFILGSTFFSDYWGYSKEYHANSEAWMDVIHGTAPAPQQYRVAVVLLADLLRKHAHIGLRHAFTLIDCLSGMIAMYLLLGLLERTQAYRRATNTARWVAVASFLFLTQYYFAWVTWYQRPETFVTLFTISATLWLLSVRLPGVWSPASTTALMLALAALQGFIRADIAVALHLGIFLVCLTRMGDGLSIPRTLQAATSFSAAILAGSAQYYLMRIVYPHASYGNIHPFALVDNLTDWSRSIPFVLFVAPWAWTFIATARLKLIAEPALIAVLSASTIYMGLWWVMGKIDEVRIFLPYAAAVIPLTCLLVIVRAESSLGAAELGE